MQAQAQARPQQLRGFIAVWVSMTLLIGIATFLAIYVGTGSLNGDTTASALSRSAGNSAVAQNVNNPISDNDPSLAIVPNSGQSENNIENNAPVDTSAQNTQNDAADNDAQNDINTTENNPADADSSVSNGETTNSDVALLQTEEADAPPAQETATPVPQPTTPANLNSDFDLGVQMAIDPNHSEIPGHLSAASEQLGLNWVKLQVRWEFIEPEQGVYDWSQLDAFFNLTPDYDIKVMTSIVTTPDWARESGANLEMHGPPADYQVFASFVATLLNRYPGRIHAIEIWNEQNLDREWKSVRGISPTDYVNMATIVANTARFIDPNIIIISGALSPTGVDNADVWSDFRYADGMIAAGVLNVVDCFGAHHNGYNIGPSVAWDQVPNDPEALFRGPFDNPHPSWSFYTTLTTYANKIQAAGSAVPLCVTEFGWATVKDLPAGYPPGFEFAVDNTLQEHGDFIVEAIQLMESWDFVWLAFIWNLNFGPVQGFDSNNDNVPYSLIRNGYQYSPAWIPIQQMDFRGRER